jgi:hypothetical protein
MCVRRLSYASIERGRVKRPLGKVYSPDRAMRIPAASHPTHLIQDPSSDSAGVPVIVRIP